MERRTMLAALKSAARRLRNRTAGRSLPEAGEMFFALPRQEAAQDTVSRAAAAIAGRERAAQRISLPETAETRAAGSTAALREGGAVVAAGNASAARTGSVSAPGEAAALPGGALSALAGRTAAALSGRESVFSGGARALFRSGAAFAVSGAAARRGEAATQTASAALAPAAAALFPAAGEAFASAAPRAEAGAAAGGVPASPAALEPVSVRRLSAAREDGEGGLRFVPQPVDRASSPPPREADAGADAPRTARRASGRGAGGESGNFWEQWARRFAGELHSSPEGVHR